MGLRVRLRYMGEKILKIADHPARYVAHGDCYSVDSEIAEVLIRKHDFQVVRDPHGLIIKDGVVPIPQDNSGVFIGPNAKELEAKNKGQDRSKKTDGGGSRKS